jgi:hypothetical protein
MNSNLYVSELDGSLYKGDSLVRENYQRTHAEIRTVADLKATLRNGSVVWPGGYPLAFWTRDGAALSFETVRAEFVRVVDAIKRDDVYSGWLVVACDVNWEDADLVDAHTGKPIEAAYGVED